jgi:hypothetical protein
LDWQQIFVRVRVAALAGLLFGRRSPPELTQRACSTLRGLKVFIYWPGNICKIAGVATVESARLRVQMDASYG